MVLVETTVHRKAATRFTSGTAATFPCPCHATSSGGTIILTTLGATESVEEAGLVLGTVRVGQLRILVRRDVARFAATRWHELGIGAAGQGRIRGMVHGPMGR